MPTVEKPVKSTKVPIAERSDHAVFTFGRANPPTTGHAKLVHTIINHAKKVGADHHIYLSHSQDSKKNPLTHEQKTDFLQKMVPEANIHKEQGVKTVIDALKHLHGQGYKKATMFVGGDRLQQMSNLAHQYNGKDYKFDELNILSAGDRDPDAEGIEGMSASKMRMLAQEKNFSEFKKGVQNPKYAKEIYQAVRKGMKLESFQALFLVGGPGSGKDFVLRSIINEQKTLEISLDKLFAAISEQRDLPELKSNPAIIVNGNADDGAKIYLAAQVLEAVGYKTGMIYVYTSDEESRERNEERINRGSKTITEDLRAAKYSTSIDNMHQFQELFSEGFFLFDNSKDNVEAREMYESWLTELPTLVEDYYKDMAKMGFKPIKSEPALPLPKVPHAVPAGYERVKDGSFWKLRRIREDYNQLFEKTYPTMVDMIAQKGTKNQQGDKYKGGIAVPGDKAKANGEHEVVTSEAVSDKDIPQKSKVPGGPKKGGPRKSAPSPMTPQDAALGTVPGVAFGMTGV